MTTRELPLTQAGGSDHAVPPLREGDRLSQAEFHRRYLAAPPRVRAELIRGVVHMAPPISLEHSDPQSELAGVLSRYQESTPGVRFNINLTSILDNSAEPEPDLLLRVLPEFGGRAKPNAKSFLVGPAELVIEVARTTAYIDLGPKLDDYKRTGVLEYLVVVVRDKTLRTFDLPADRETAPDPDGVWRSKVFPGLWIDAAAAVAADQGKLLAALRAGLATHEHAAFVTALQARRTGG